MLGLAEFLLTADQRLSNCFFIGTNHFFEEEKGGSYSRAHLHLPPSCFPKKYPAQFPPLKKLLLSTLEAVRAFCTYNKQAGTPQNSFLPDCPEGPSRSYREQWKFGLPLALRTGKERPGAFCFQNMSESSSASKTPSGAGGAKSSPSSWWKSLSGRKKSKEIPPLDPSELLFASPNSSDSWENQSPIGNRRNLRISHSGRFKEKRKSRGSLLAESPQKLFEGAGGGGAAPASPAPAHPSEETRGE